MKIPQHIAIIMDGNGRWAKNHFLPRATGHERGGKTVERVIDLCIEKGIPWLTLYAFSTENWGRSEKEVSSLMNLLKRFLKERRKDMMKKNTRLHAIGELYMLPDDVRELLDECMEETKGNTGVNLVLALSYGSRQEIAHATRRIAEQLAAGTIVADDISPELISQHLYTSDMPDPDLLIRTSGELRLSNYLLWQLSYSEIYVTETLWPDFGRKDFELALESYSQRERRYGKR